jgi:hypothetical protein
MYLRKTENVSLRVCAHKGRAPSNMNQIDSKYLCFQKSVSYSNPCGEGKCHYQERLVDFSEDSTMMPEQSLKSRRSSST